MSASASPENGKRMGLSRMVSRMKTLLKRGKSSKHSSASTASSAFYSAAAPINQYSEPSGLVSTGPVSTAPRALGSLPTKPEGPRPVTVTRSEIEAERIRKIYERFTKELKDLELTESNRPDREAYRVEKPIRMRIHRTCHLCNATFGNNKLCWTCQHPRCSRCPRHPTEMKAAEQSRSGKPADMMEVMEVDEDVKEKGKGNLDPATDADMTEVDSLLHLKGQIILMRPSRIPGAQPLVRKKPKQRVRRACHQCEATFPSGHKICLRCQHVRCTDCPRDPSKRKYYPDGYPGDMFNPASLAPLKYTCHQCSNLLPSIPHPSSPEGLALGESAPPPVCARCEHVKCPECARAPICKVEPPLDPDIVMSVERRLAELRGEGSGEIEVD